MVVNPLRSQGRGRGSLPRTGSRNAGSAEVLPRLLDAFDCWGFVRFGELCGFDYLFVYCLCSCLFILHVIYLYLCLYIYIYIYIYIPIHLSLYIYIYIYIYICVCVCVRVYDMYMYMHIYKKHFKRTASFSCSRLPRGPAKHRRGLRSGPVQGFVQRFVSARVGF